jgi:hypothetical protein
MPTLIADLFVQNPIDRDDQFSSALERAIAAASGAKDRGILITRHHYSRYTITLSPTVPYGETREHDLVQKSAGEV